MGHDATTGDLAEPEKLLASMAGRETLFLLPPPLFDQTTFEANALAAAHRAGVDRIVKISGDANFAPRCRGKGHVLGEIGLHRSTLRWAVLRLGLLPDFWKLDAPIRKGLLPIVAAGGGTPSFSMPPM